MVSWLATRLEKWLVSELVYTSLAVDPGLQPLMPYLSKFIFDQVNKSLCNLPLLNSVMRLTRCILINPNLDKELYLHQMMPPILTCIVHRKLCASPFMDHWALRNFAASLIPLIYTQFGETYKDIKPRITKTLRAALLSKDRPMTTQYGAIVGISAMGPLTVQAILLPVMRKLLIRYNKVMRMNGGASPSVLKCLEAQHCIGALQTAFGSFIRACSSPILSKAILLEEHLEPAQVAAAVAGEPILSWAPAENTSSELQLFI
uniref:TAF6 C-terminal HEAT repeat domain-containing protein n=1 Tax=Mucochytrium quahogii TaxID=96639 RepID=A0A7S2RDG4_9STRA